MQPNSIAYIAGQLIIGGAEQQLYYLLAGLDQLKYRAIVINLGLMGDEYWARPIADLGIPVRHLPPNLGRARRVHRIAKLLRNENVKIVHGWMFHTNPYAALAGRLANAPIRLGSMREHYQGLPSGKWLRWIGCRDLDALITNSGETTRQVEKCGVTRARVHTVPNGVPIPETVGSAERCNLKMQLGFSKTDILIGSIGRLDENKNYSMLLEAVVPLTNEWPNLRLIIIGDGPMKSQLLESAHKLKIADKIKLPGKIPQAARFLHAMDVCCLTSHTEGMPNLVMEAAAAGLPVVSTRCGDTAELIDHGRSGFLVADGDSSDMAGYLKRLITQPEQRREMGCAAQERMRRDFSIGTMVKRMTGIYEDMLGAKGLT